MLAGANSQQLVFMLDSIDLLVVLSWSVISYQPRNFFVTHCHTLSFVITELSLWFYNYSTFRWQFGGVKIV